VAQKFKYRTSVEDLLKYGLFQEYRVISVGQGVNQSVSKEVYLEPSWNSSKETCFAQCPV